MKLTSGLISLLLVLLSSCGGQNSPVASNSSTLITTAIGLDATGLNQTIAKVSLMDSLAKVYPNGQLPANRVAQAAKDLAQNPAALKLTAPAPTSTNIIQSQKAGIKMQSMALAADFLPVARIQNTTLVGSYFFSIYDAEIENALISNPDWILEGAAFWASIATGDGLSPVHRFRNLFNGSYLYTIFEAEKASIIRDYSQYFTYEGVSWYARQTQAAGWTPLYRFRNLTNGTYLFTAYESEKNAIVANYPNIFELEGIAYYVRQDAPVDGINCIPPTCYPPAARPAPSSSKNVFWLRTDSSQYEFLTSNQLIYSESISYVPTMHAYDHSMGFDFGSNRFFLKPSVNFSTVYQNQYNQENMVDSNAVFKMGLNKYASDSTYGISPTLRVGTDGKGCDRSTGAFYIHELETAANGNVIKFAADFNINCSGAATGGANGVVRFNSNIASVLPQIFAVAGPDFAVQEGSRLPLLGHLSWSPSSKIKTAKWTQISGPTLDLSRCAQLTCDTYAPLMPAGGANAVLKLTVESESGLIASDTVNVAIRSNLDKQTRVDVWGKGFAAGAVGRDLHLNDLSARIQVPRLQSLGAIYQNQTNERVHVIARGRTQNGGELITGVDMAFMNKAGLALVPGSYLNADLRGGYEAFPESASVDVSVNGAGCGHQIASMHVGDIQRDLLDFGKISSLSILAQVNCTDAGLDEATYSRLWINHQPINIPVAKITGATQSSAGQQVALNSNTSLVKKGTLVNKVWRVIYSTADASLSNVGSDTITLNFGANSPSGSKAVVSLEVFDSTGDSGTTLHTITIQ